MAVRRRRSLTGSGSRGGRRSSKRKVLKIKVAPAIAREIWAVINLAIGLLTILSLQGTFGVVGNLWVNFLKPVVGWGIYVVPALFILVATMMFASKKLHFGPSRILGMVLFMISLLSIFHLSVPAESIYTFAAAGRYGGYTGFVTNFLLLNVLGVGEIAATIIFVAIFLVSILLVFELSLKELLIFVIPEIRIETDRSAKEVEINSKNGKKDQMSIEEMIPEEIRIHKAQIGSDPHNNAVIYGDDDVEDKPDKIVINEAQAQKMSEELSRREKEAEAEEYEWEFPTLDLLKPGDSNVHVDEKLLKKNAEIIRLKLKQFGIDVLMHEVNVGPTVIQFTLKPHDAVKLSKITALKNDMALALAAERIRIEAPIPGKSFVGIEVPNNYRAVVCLREILESAEFVDSRSKLTLPMGRSVSGTPVVASLDTMPHLLIAGATGSGKSVCMNAFLVSLLYQNSPKDLKMILIDPKRVELSSYNSVPHLLTPVVQDPDKAAIALRWVVAEMSRRYSELSNNRVRNIYEYNELKDVNPLPRIVVVIDELADLMMVAGKEVEASICRIAQMARAVGIHLIVATQRPSVDVITGLIKANIPSRIAFAVSSQVDSRTILDAGGADDLLGRGDMLYLPTGMNKPMRLQGVMITTEEIERVTNRIKLTVEPHYDDSITSVETAQQRLVGVPDSHAGGDDDDMYEAAFALVRETRKASASLLQRRLKVGYARAARLIDLLEENGVVGPADGAKPRKILMD